MHELIMSNRLFDIINDAYERSLIARVLWDYRLTADHHQSPITTARLNYLDFRDGMLTYLPAGREHVTGDDGEWFRGNRQAGKPGRVVRRLLLDPDAYHDADYEEFVAALRARDSIEHGEITIVHGEEIREIYQTCEDVGCGLASCMTNRTEYLDLYVTNPDRVGLLTARDGGGDLIARALIWTLDDGHTYLDRVYGGILAGYLVADHANAAGWVAWRNGRWATATGESADVVVTLKHHRHRYYPYMDTMSVYYPQYGMFSTTGRPGHGKRWQLTSTGGGPGIWVCSDCDKDLSTYPGVPAMPLDGVILCRQCRAARGRLCARGCGTVIGGSGYRLDQSTYCYRCYGDLCRVCRECGRHTHPSYIVGNRCRECRRSYAYISGDRTQGAFSQ